MLLLLLVVLLLPSTQGGPVGTFLSSPRSLLVNSGSEARLACRVRAGAGPCQWTRDGYGPVSYTHLTLPTIILM